MRVISGDRKGHRIGAGKRAGLRPTSDRAKESIFNVLRGEVMGKRILDLFAGAGSLGIEALSRGAEQVTFVDASLRSINVLRENLDNLNLKDRSKVIRSDAVKALGKLEQSFHLIFADPPYLKGFAQRIISRIAQSEVLSIGGILILEHHKKETFSYPEEHLSLLKQKKFGDTVITFLQKKN